MSVSLASLSIATTSHPQEEAARLKTAYLSLTNQVKTAPRQRYIAGIKLLADQYTGSSNVDAEKITAGEVKRMESAESAEADESPVDMKNAPELLALKKKYEEERAAAVKPLLDKYSASLQILVRSVTQSGDLTTAVSIRDQLTSATCESGIVGLWRWVNMRYTPLRVFHRDGRLGEVPKDNAIGTWSVKDGKLVIQNPDPSTNTFPLPMDPKGAPGHWSRGMNFTASKEN